MKKLQRYFHLPLLCSALSVPCYAQAQNAGSPLVLVDASTLPIGPLQWATNNGASGGVFRAVGSAESQRPIVTAVGGGAKGILFDGNTFLEHATTPTGALLPAPAALTGANPVSSIEAWVVNPTFWAVDGETIVAWGARELSMRNMAFAYGANPDHGAVDRWGGNLGWGATVPAAAVWHHLVMTFDGNVTRVYADGTLRNSLINNSVNTLPGMPITIAGQRNNDGTINTGGSKGTMIVGRLSIYNTVLTADAIAQHYNADKTNFVFAPASLAQRPASRFSFSNASTNDAVGVEVPDIGTAAGASAIIQGTPGTMSPTLNGSRVRLSGGASDTAPYIDLPNGIMSSRSAANGGTGKLTIEGWVNITGNPSWFRLFDFGSTDAGEIAGPAPSGPAGRNYFMFSQVNDWRDWHHLEVNNNGYNGGPNIGSSREFGLYNGTSTGFGLRHYAVTWDEATGELNLYENGILSTRLITPSKMNHVDDVNAWLGRSNWTADQNMAGDYDEFRVYNHVLSPAEVRNNYDGGPDAVLVAPGTLQTLQIVPARTNMMSGTFQNIELIGNFQNVTNVSVTSRSGVVFTSANTNVLTISAQGLVTAIGAGTAMISASYEGRTNSFLLTVTPESAPLLHRYTFDNDAMDVIGGAQYQGMANNGATFTGSELFLEGTSSYVELPAGLITNLDAVTIETWASFGSPLGTWSELFAFGDRTATGQGATYIMMTPHSGNNDARVVIADGNPGFNHEQFAGRSGVLDGQTNVHIAAVYHPQAGYIALYLNGALAAINRNVTIPLTAINDAIGLIGQSIYQSDPYVNAWVSDFRIYGGPLNARQIAVNAAAGPNRVVADPGVLQSVGLTAPTQVLLRATSPLAFTGTFANVGDVNLAAFGATFTSGNTNILTVSPSGLITGLAPGTTTIVGSYGGYSQTQTVTIVNLPAVLTHRYSFNGTANDLVGTANAQLFGSAQVVNGQLALDGSAGAYADLGSGILTGHQAVTFETWSSFGQNFNWSRLWDFGSQDAAGAAGVTSIFFTPHSGGGAGEMTIFAPGANDHIWPVGMGVLDNTTNLHIVAVYDPNARYQGLYFNGMLVAENRNASIPISSINNVYSFLGRSLFANDAYVNASIDEFRLYNGALSPTQVAINNAAGPNSIVTNTGALLNVRLVATTNMLVDARQQVGLLANYANVSGVNLFALGDATITSSAPEVVTVDKSGNIRAVGSGTAILTAVYNGVSYSTTIVVANPALTLKHRYGFNEAPGATVAVDSVSGANATLMPGADFDGAGRMVLDGTNGYAALPSPIISVLSNATFEVWVTPTSAGNWQRILDFGIDDGGVGSSYVFLSSRGAPGVRFTVKPVGGPEAPVLNAETPLFIGQQSHLVAVYNASAGVASLYQNGQLVSSGAIVTPLSAIPDTNNWLGRSQYQVDSLFAGTYEEFRIWDGPMMPSQVAASFATGPGELPVPQIKASLGTNNTMHISWPVWGRNFVLQQRTSLEPGTQWEPFPASPVNTGSAYTVTIPTTGQSRFFRIVRQ